MLYRYLYILFTGIFGMLLQINANAQLVAENKAAEVASAFFASKNLTLAEKPVSVYLLNEDGNLPALYIFQFSGKGFVIVSADSAAFPVIGYSITANWPENELPDQLSEWLKNYTDQIYQIRKLKLKPDSRIYNAWLKPETIFQYHKNQRSIEPLTLSLWNQGTFFNDSCPAVDGGQAGRALAGCVPVAMAQVLYFHRFPVHGTGSHSYTIPSLGIQCSANFGNTRYNWDGMLANPDRFSPSLSQLIYHCGVAVEASYSASGTGASTEETEVALKQYFGYSDETIFYQKSDYQDSVWKLMLRANLELNQPLIYKGSMGGWVGHAWVCDGFDGAEYFHFNWGWSGIANGYYYLDNLNPGNYDFTFAQGAVFNIRPIDSSVSSIESDTIRTPSGTFCNHQWPEADSLSLRHQWLIDPQGNNYGFLQIKTGLMQLYEGDSLLIFQGNDPTGTPLHILTTDNFPEVMHLNGSVALVKSICHSAQSKWAFSYLAHNGSFCHNNTNYTSINGYIWDGSGNFYLNPHTNCSWLIQPHTQETDSIDRIEINFPRFLLNSSDSVFVYDGADSDSPVLAKLSGDDQPQTLVSTGSKAFIQLKTDTLSTTSDGLEITYNSLLPEYCQELTTLNSTSGIITNGSNGYNYHNNSLCHWLIESDNAQDITFTFNKLNTEPNRDRIEFYKAGIYPEQLIMIVSGDEIPPPFTIAGNKFRIVFRTDETIVNKGWELEYHINSLAIEKLTSSDPGYYPVPAENELTLELPVNFRNSKFIIADITGKQLIIGQTEETDAYSVNISFLKPGMYLFSIDGADKCHTFRFIKR